MLILIHKYSINYCQNTSSKSAIVLIMQPGQP